MPSAPPKPCSHPGCGTLITIGSRCPAHSSQPTASAAYDARRRADPVLAEVARFRSGKYWTKFSSYFRAQHPLCCDPFKMHGVMPAMTQAIHHIVPLHQRMDLGLVETNCRPLCHRCHNRVEGMERRGEATASLFLEAPLPPGGEVKSLFG